MEPEPGDAQYMKIPKFKNFKDELRGCLVAFERRKDWADLTKAIVGLQKTLLKYKDVGVIPEKLLLSKRLGQTLNTSLPGGVHKKTLELYKTIFMIVGPKLQEDLPFYAPGLFKLFPDSSIDIKPMILDIYEQYFAKIPPKSLRPCLGGFLSSILPVLEEENSELYPRVLALLQDIQTKFCQEGMQESVMLHLWEALKFHEQSRLACLNYLITILPRNTKKRSEGTLTLELLGGSTELCVSAMTTVLSVHNDLVLRAGLDLLGNCMMLHVVEPFTESQKAELMHCALLLMCREELPLTRRISKWFSGEDKPCPQYFTEHTAPRIEAVLKKLIVAAKKPSEASIVVKLIELLTPETQTAVMSEYCEFLLSGVAKPVDGLKPVRTQILLEHIAKCLSPESDGAKVKTAVDLTTLASGYIEVKQKSYDRLMNILQNGLGLVRDSERAETAEGCEMVLNAIRTLTILTKAFGDVLSAGGFREFSEEYFAVARQILEKTAKGEEGCNGKLVTMSISYIKECLVVLKNSESADTEYAWVPSIVELCSHDDWDIALSCIQLVIDLINGVCGVRVASQLEGHAKDVVRHLWRSLDECDDSLHKRCEIVMQICTAGVQYNNLLNEVATEDLTTPYKVDDGFTRRFTSAWHALTELSTPTATVTLLLKKPLFAMLSTILSSKPVEKAKGVSFLDDVGHSAESVPRVLDPILDALSPVEVGEGNGEEVERTMELLEAVLNNAPNYFVTSLVEVRVAGSTEVTYLDEVVARNIEVIKAAMEGTDGVSPAVRGAAILELVVARSSVKRDLGCVKAFTGGLEKVTRLLKESLLPEPTPVLSLRLVKTAYSLARYVQNKADYADYIEINDGTNKSFASNHSYDVPPSPGGTSTYQTLVSLIIDGITLSSTTPALGDFHQWCRAYKDFLPLLQDVCVGLAEASRAHFIQLLHTTLETLTPRTLSVVEEILGLLAALGSTLLSLQPKKDSGSPSGGLGIRSNLPTFLGGGVSFGGAVAVADERLGCEIALEKYCEGFDDYLRAARDVQAAAQDTTKPFTLLKHRSVHNTTSSLLTVMYKAHPWHFLNGVIYLWASHILKNSWKPIVDPSEANVHYVNLLLLVQPLGVKELIAGVIEVTTDLVSKQVKSRQKGGSHLGGNYELYGADLLTHYITHAPVGVVAKIAKSVPSVLGWMRDMMSQHVAHLFSYPIFLRLLCVIVKRMAEVVNTGGEVGEKCKAVLQDKKAFKEIVDTFTKLLDSIPRLMVNTPEPTDSPRAVDILAAAMDFITAELKTIRSTPFLGTSERISGVIVTIHQQYFVHVLRAGDELTEREKSAQVRKNSIRRIHSILTFLTEAVKVFTSMGMRALRPLILEHISDTHFFRVDPTTLSLWKTLFNQLVGGSDGAVKEMIDATLQKIQLPTGVGSVFTNADREAQTRSRGLRKLAFLLISSGTHLSNAHLLATILEKLIESLKNYSEWPLVTRQILLCFRAILCQTDAHSLASFWPLIVTELVSVLTEKKGERALVIEALKVIDMARVVLPSDYHVYRWVFVESESGKEASDSSTEGVYVPLLERFARACGDTDMNRVLSVIAGVRVDGGSEGNGGAPLLAVPDVLSSSASLGELAHALQDVSTELHGPSPISGVTSSPVDPNIPYIIHSMLVDLAELHLLSPNSFFKNLNALTCTSSSSITRAESLTQQPSAFVRPAGAQSRTPPPIPSDV